MTAGQALGAERRADGGRERRARSGSDPELTANGGAFPERSSPGRETRRNEVARLRDETAGSRDRAADVRDRTAKHEGDALLHTQHPRAAAVRALVAASEEIREFAAADRASAANDRRLAAADRLQASTDSSEARIELEQAQLDGLTGAHRRDQGRIALQHEIDQARRSSEPFVLAFIDVDGLKQLNDREGHVAGDVLLRAVVVALRGKLRADDPIVRVGGDEFLCGFTNTKLEAATRRVEEIRATLQQVAAQASISVGLATLGERDTLEKLIARSDADMYSGKQRGRPEA
jgi:diguanylate cyclase (GGDEF)-like protein